MDFFVYKDKIEAALKNQKLDLEAMIKEGLRNRKQFVGEMSELILDLSSTHRRKLLEILIRDGSVDLIPLFIDAIEKEPDALYAKALLGLYAKFEHYEALGPLKVLKSKLNYTLDRDHQRVVSKLNAKFREHFYMDEFQAGNKNFKRLSQAVKVMLSGTDPVYVPFISAMILHEDPVYRSPGVRVLAHLGDLGAVDPLLELMGMLLKEQGRSNAFQEILIDEDMLQINSLQSYMEELGRRAEWEPKLVDSLVVEVLEKNLDTTMAWVSHSFGPIGPALWDSVTDFLTSLLIEGDVPKAKKKRLELAFKGNWESKRELINNVTMAIGKIGRRTDSPELVEQVENAIPEDNPKRESYLVSMLAGFCSEKARISLLEHLEKSTDPDLLLETLNALEAFELKEVPPKLYQLAKDPDYKRLRVKAMELIGASRPSSEDLGSLLQHEKMSVRIDVIAMIAEYKLQSGYNQLIEMLKEDPSQNLLLALVEALAPFPRSTTGEAVYPFFLMPNPYSIRQAALVTLVQAGGPKRMTMVFQGLETYKEEKVPEVLSSIFLLIEPLPTEEQSPDLVNLPEIWGDLLKNENERFRLNSLTILEKADWDLAIDLETWVEVLADALKDRTHPRKLTEQRRLKGLLLKARSRQVMNPVVSRGKRGRQMEKMLNLLEFIENGTESEKLASLRMINVMYKPNLLPGRDCERLVYLIELFFDESKENPEHLKLAISMASRIGHPNMVPYIKDLLNHENAELVRFARSGQTLIQKCLGLDYHEIQSILVLEETPELTEALYDMLKEKEYDVDKADDEVTCIAALAEKPYDLLILANKLPNGDGLEFWRRAKRQRVAPDKIVFVTGNKEEEGANTIASSGADWLFKPISPDQLYNKIKDIDQRSAPRLAG